MFFRKALIRAALLAALLCSCMAAPARAAPQNEPLTELSTPLMVAPGGQSIGVMMNTAGVTVVGFAAVYGASGQLDNPAAAAGLMVGDFITAINGETVADDRQVAELIDAAGAEGRTCSIDYLREGSAGSISVSPELCADSESWRIGLYVRDNTAGLGTLTFYDPQTLSYAALGHSVGDLAYGVEQQPLGSVIRAEVQSIRTGAPGQPGEKLGVFLNEAWSGDIRANGLFGIYGQLQALPQSGPPADPLPVAEIGQVQLGPALIYTVIDGEQVNEFTINIVRIMENNKSSGRGMIVEVTDPQLLDAAGGIVQGMSGSPIIQNNMLVGAITHVFVNDSRHGYACFAQWMLEEAQQTAVR